MNRDPIVDEVRQARQSILEDCDGDLDKLLDRFQAAEAKDRNRIVFGKSGQAKAQRHSPRPVQG